MRRLQNGHTMPEAGISHGLVSRTGIGCLRKILKLCLVAKSFTRKEEGTCIVYDAVEIEESLALNDAFLKVLTASSIADGP